VVIWQVGEGADCVGGRFAGIAFYGQGHGAVEVDQRAVEVVVGVQLQCTLLRLPGWTGLSELNERVALVEAQLCFVVAEC
jgi:hypothetical protein